MPEFIRPARAIILEGEEGFPWGAIVGVLCLLAAVGLTTWFLAEFWPLILACLAATAVLTAVVLWALHRSAVRVWRPQTARQPAATQEFPESGREADPTVTAPAWPHRPALGGERQQERDPWLS